MTGTIGTMSKISPIVDMTANTKNLSIPREIFLHQITTSRLLSHYSYSGTVREEAEEIRVHDSSTRGSRRS